MNLNFIFISKVNKGTATPTNYYVHMNYPKIIPKLTFNLCFIYFNWNICTFKIC